MIFYFMQDAQGYRHVASTQAEAKEINKDFNQVDVPIDKAGLHAFLTELLMEQNDLIDKLRHQINDKPIPKPEPKKQSYTEFSVQIDEVFGNLPLAHQLSLALIALDNAIYQIRPSKTEPKDDGPTAA